MRCRCAFALVVVIAAIGASGAGCRSGSVDVSSAERPDAGAPPAKPPPLPDALSAESRPSSPRLVDPAWRRVLEGDPADAIRLAQSEGAGGLLEGLEDGGAVARAALLSLPYAEDAELSLARICELAKLAASRRVEALAPLLEAILGVAGRPPAPREPLDQDGAVACGEVLLELSGREELPLESRRLSVSAARAFVERGTLAPARVPVGLDPP